MVGPAVVQAGDEDSWAEGGSSDDQETGTDPGYTVEAADRAFGVFWTGLGWSYELGSQDHTAGI